MEHKKKIDAAPGHVYLPTISLTENFLKTQPNDRHKPDNLRAPCGHSRHARNTHHTRRSDLDWRPGGFAATCFPTVKSEII